MEWTAKWIDGSDPGRRFHSHVVVEYFHAVDNHVGTLHVSADQRFVLFADEVEIARGPTRGSVDAWPFHTVMVDRHVKALRALVWSMHDTVAPQAQQSQWHGFLLQAPGCDTGSANWQARTLVGYRFESLEKPYNVTFPGGSETFDARVPIEPWRRPSVRDDAYEIWGKYGEQFGHRLMPDPLPAVARERWTRQTVRHVDHEHADERFAESDDTTPWQALLDDGSPVTVPPHSRVRLLIDLNDYVCGYDRIDVSGVDTCIGVGWQEALVDEDGTKGHRDEITGKCFRGRWNWLDVGSQPITHQTLWWSAGRYRCVTVTTADEPAIVSALDVIETRYPLELRSEQSVTQEVDALVPMCFRTLQMCAHETYMDCPHYEQMQYVGDTRVQALLSYACVGDDRLAKHALRSFARSTTPDGLVRARFPDRQTQVIPQFALFWIGMLHDFLMWRDETALVRDLMSTVRAVCEAFLTRRRGDGLVDWPEGWNWVDWKDGWTRGQPPGADAGLPSGINHWQLIYILGLASELERFVGEDALADRLTAARNELMAATEAVFWDEATGGWADTPERDSFSQHAQCYAILAGAPASARAGQLLDGRADVTQGSFYFQHYVFDALHALGRGGEVLNRLAPWRQMRAIGLRTTAERAEPTRSDCHAWSAHPLLHIHTTLAGIRPAAPGFAKVAVEPAVPNLSVRMVHPRGAIAVNVDDGSVTVELPDGVSRV